MADAAQILIEKLYTDTRTNLAPVVKGEHNAAEKRQIRFRHRANGYTNFA